jgi:hypothetical protein
VSEHASPAKERRKADLRYAAVAVVAVGSFATMAIWMQGLSDDLRVSNDARDALARQVQSLGHKPVAGPPGSRGEAGASVVGPRGPQGDTGASGKPAPTITPKPGTSGASGSPGKPGADSTVAGPTGPPGADSTVAGPQGEAGPVGQSGRDGKDGVDGQPPADWTYTWTDSAGVTHTVTCTRAANFDPGSPQYDCTDSSPSQSPTAPANPEAGLLVLSAVTAHRRSQAMHRKAHSRRAAGRHRSAGRRGGAHL